MDQVEQENIELHGEVTTLWAEVEKLTAMVTSLVAAQNQPLTPPPQAIVVSEIVSAPVPGVPVSTHQHVMPEGYPWGMPLNFNEEFRPQVSEVPTPTLPHAAVVPQPGMTLPQVTVCVPQSTITTPAPVVHTVPYVSEQVYHAEDPETYGRMDNLQDQFDKMQLEIKALRGKDLFGKNAHDLCLVPNVRIPPKFKVPEFEKYKGNSCPQRHLVMYARKMSTQTDNHQLLVHYFQDSLTGAALKWYTGLDGAKIQTFNDLGEAFVRQYKYNLDMAPDRDQLRGMSQKDKESFKEYAQRRREIAAQICPPLEEKEMTKIFLNTLDSFYYERMIASTPSDFTEMVNMGMRLEEGVRQGRLVRENVPVSSTKRFGTVPPVPQNPPYQPQMTQRPPSQYPPLYQHAYPQQPYPQRPQNHLPGPQQPFSHPSCPKRSPPFDPIPMKYAELLLTLLAKNLVHTRPPPPVPAILPTWYRADLTCAFHHGAPGHDVERYQSIAKPWRFCSFNPKLSGENVVFKVRNIKTTLVPIHEKMCEAKLFSHEHATCGVCSKNPRGCTQIQNDIQGLLDKGELVVTRKSEDICVIVPEFNISDRLEMIYNSGESVVTPLVIHLPGPVPYTSLKAIPYRYNATMLQDGVETPIPSSISVDNIADGSRILRSERVLQGAVQEKTSTPALEEAQVRDSSKSGERVYEDSDEVLKLIKRSEYKIVDQLLQTPSKISILSLLVNSDAHREALMKVLDQVYVDHDVTLGQFGSIVGNVTACNNLSFSDEELLEKGRDHNLALHISVICKSDALSNVLVDTGSSLNVMSKITLDKLAYRGASLRPSALIVKAFDGSRKSVIGEIDLPISVGPHEFQITFQVMDIQASYSCLLGRPWIHEAGAVTSTLHQKLKFVREGKMVIVNGEEALLVSHLSAFSYISADVGDGTAFQGLSIEEKGAKKAKTFMSSAKDAQREVQQRSHPKWGKLLQIPEKKRMEGLGFAPSARTVESKGGIFVSAGLIHAPPEANAIIEDKVGEEQPSFVIPGGTCRNWVVVDVPSVTPLSKLSINEPVKHNVPRPSPNFEFPVYEAEEEEDKGIPDEIKRLLDQEKKFIQPHEEDMELIDLSSGEEKREIKIGALLETTVKEKVIELLKEYVDIFACSYQDMPGLDPEIVEHRLPLKPECPPVKQKLRRTSPDMALKIKEEVQKQIDAGFLITSEYPQWLANIVPVPKKDGKVRMCVDYRDLNKASPKDDFPLPHIYVLVDSTAKSKVFSFMDGFSGYNQIKMAVEDREKTSFITPWGTFCYKVMPFGLTNAGTTYQRGMTTLFHDMMHKEVEVSGKLLGFIVSQKGIEVDPDKVRAIREMPAPQTEKQVRGFLGRLNYISRFISHMTATCGPIFKLLRKNQGIVWTEDCQKAFDSIKEYLTEPPILIPPIEGRPLIMYLTVLEESMGCVLGQQDEIGRKEHVIYYLSKKFTDCEFRYSMLEKTCCALAWAAKLIITPKGSHIPFSTRLQFDCTNNIAEYEACIMGIEEAIYLRIKNIDIYGDSALVVNQIKGEWETRHAGLIPYRDYARRLLTFFNKVELHHIPRDENQMADALATLSSMYQVNHRNDTPTISIRCLERPAYVFTAEEVSDDKPWFHDIKMFLQNQEYPPGASNKDRKTLRRLSSSFFLNGDVLYKRNFDMVLLRCVDKHEADLLMHQVHEGSFGTHPSGHTMAKKMLRAGYYWLTMESDCHKHARKCHKCQIYADKIHVPPTSLNVLSSPWPFSMWGIDMIGRIEPKASNGHRFILVAIDYFTKWVHQESYANVTKQVVVRFIKNHIICRYGVHNRIITDNGTNLNNKMMKDLCDEFKIEHHNSSPYRPQMNGAVEAANKNIKKIVQKMVVTYKDWHEMLPFALHGYRTSVRTSTGATPFSLVYGMEAVLPVEVEIPSMRVLMEAELTEAEWCQSRYDQLNLIEEKRLTALCHGQLYQRRMKHAFDKKVRPRELREGDLVLKKILSFQPDSRGKWTPNYEGPYVVKRVFSGGAMTLTTMDGGELPRPVNADAVKKYFV
ncbi:hypothetical protein TSUD_363910 [Trifolium subterraneum]|uniref:Uncharacterized protein n=1 Tax=Trifolium subterraneum TaxID=3900 RepID=A0A2Z6NR89_TRISU|nr:hypothetical protein TSUD_363910 [Trifolium subterraneum]